MPSRSRWVALGLSAGAVVSLTGGMAATAGPQVGAPTPLVSTPEAGVTTIPGGAEPAGNPFAGRPSLTQTGAS